MSPGAVEGCKPSSTEPEGPDLPIAAAVPPGGPYCDNRKADAVRQLLPGGPRQPSRGTPRRRAIRSRCNPCDGQPTSSTQRVRLPTRVRLLGRRRCDLAIGANCGDGEQCVAVWLVDCAVPVHSGHVGSGWCVPVRCGWWTMMRCSLCQMSARADRGPNADCDGCVDKSVEPGAPASTTLVIP